MTVIKNPLELFSMWINTARKLRLTFLSDVRATRTLQLVEMCLERVVGSVAGVCCQELIKNTDEQHPERRSLERALEEMQVWFVDFVLSHSADYSLYVVCDHRASCLIYS